MIKQQIKEYILRIINGFMKKKPNSLVFIPHGGCYKDGYSILNPKSDNSLSLMDYIIHTYGDLYEYSVAVGYQEYESVSLLVRTTYPNVSIKCFPYFRDRVPSRKYRKIFYENIFTIFFKASYIFTSEGISMHYRSKKQKVIFLGYFIPFKNDYLPIKAGIVFDSESSRTYDYCITTSLLSSQIIAHTYDIPLYKFHSLGFSRNDELLKKYESEKLDEFIKHSVSYPVNRVFLYTPTHRDYEQNLHDSIRDVLGFQVDNAKLSSLLREYGAIIVCKVHSKQNREALRKELPEGVILHQPNSAYGLCELMQRSDYLITDYTSAYFDYLLLDRPVLFNFYDFEKYKEYRGFSFDPLDAIVAGEIFNDEESFYDKLRLILSGIDVYKEKRIFVKELVHKYTDTHSSERICNFILRKDK